MNIHETEDIVLKWIRSCDKEEQIDILAEVVAEFVVNRFEKLESDITIQITRKFLISEMADQKLIIKRKKLHLL